VFLPTCFRLAPSISAIIVDGAVIMTENIMRHLSHQKNLKDKTLPVKCKAQHSRCAAITGNVLSFRFFGAEVAHNIFCHDDCAIHDDAEIDGAKRKQVAGTPRKSIKMKAREVRAGSLTQR